MRKTIFLVLILAPLGLLAGENSCLDSSGNFKAPLCSSSVAIKAAVTVDTSAYASGDAIGTNLTFSNAARADILTGRIKKVVVSDAGAQVSNLELVCYNIDATATTDQAAFDPPDTEIDDIVGPILISNHYTYNDNSVSSSGDINVPFGPLASSSLECSLVSRGTPDYVAAGDLTVTIYVERD